MPADRLAAIQHLLIHSKEFPWYYYEAANSVYSETELDWAADYQDLPQLVHGLISPPGDINSPHAEYLLNECGLDAAIASLLLNEGMTEFRRIHRFKANLLPPTQLQAVSEPHIDYDMPCAALLFYVNDSDGDTVFFDRAMGDDLAGMSEVARITPRAGDFVLFDGRQYHAGTPPTRSRGRFVLSFVLK